MDTAVEVLGPRCGKGEVNGGGGGGGEICNTFKIKNFKELHKLDKF